MAQVLSLLQKTQEEEKKKRAEQIKKLQQMKELPKATDTRTGLEKLLIDNAPLIGGVAATAATGGTGLIPMLLAGAIGAGGGEVVKQGANDIETNEGFNPANIAKEAAFGAGGNLIGLGATKALGKVLPTVAKIGSKKTVPAPDDLAEPVDMGFLQKLGSKMVSGSFPVPYTFRKSLAISPEEAFGKLMQAGYAENSAAGWVKRIDSITGEDIGIDRITRAMAEANKVPIKLTSVRATRDAILQKEPFLRANKSLHKEIKSFTDNVLDEINGIQASATVDEAGRVGQASAAGAKTLEKIKQVSALIRDHAGVNTEESKAYVRVLKAFQRELEDTLDEASDLSNSLASPGVQSAIDEVSGQLTPIEVQRLTKMRRTKEFRGIQQKYVVAKRTIDESLKREAGANSSAINMGAASLAGGMMGGPAGAAMGVVGQPVATAAVQASRQQVGNRVGRFLFNRGGPAQGGAPTPSINLPPALQKILMGGGQALTQGIPDIGQAEASTTSPELQKVLPETASQTQPKNAYSNKITREMVMQAYISGDDKLAKRMKEAYDVQEELFGGVGTGKMTNETRAALGKFDDAKAGLEEIEAALAKAGTTDNSILARLLVGPARKAGAKIGLDESVEMLESAREGFKSKIARLSDVGNLTKNEQDDALRLLPTVSDPTDTAREKMARIQRLLDRALERTLKYGASTAPTNDEE